MSDNRKWQVRYPRVLWLLLAVLVCPGAAYSLDNDAWNTGLNFHFYPPGARALGMGGAFVGLADDTTAAASNPAGLAQLTRMQLAIEGRYISVDGKQKSFPWTGSVSSGNMNTTSNEDDVAEVSFGAFSMPVFDNLFNVAIFYDKPMSFSVDKTSRTTVGAAGVPLGVFSWPSTTDISVDEVGLSVAKSFAEGRLMFGLGVGLQLFEMSARESNRFNNAFNFSGRVDESDEGLSARAGILAKPIDNLRLGASLTIMPRFDTRFKYRTANANGTISTFDIDSSMDIPDNFSVGAAYNIFPNWVAVFEAKYIFYSQLMNNFAVDTRYNDEGGPTASDFDVDDVVELHFGTEYVLNAIPNVPLALRAGLFYEPAHDLKYYGPSRMQRNLFDGGEDLVHFTVGTGAVFMNHFQVDVGADFTEDSENVTVSMVYQF
jgi:long-chain fatty acid transport protein